MYISYPQGGRGVARPSADLHVGHIIRVRAGAVDEQDRAGALDVSVRNQIQISVHVESGIRHLELHVLVAGAVVELDCERRQKNKKNKTSLFE